MSHLETIMDNDPASALSPTSDKPPGPSKNSDRIRMVGFLFALFIGWIVFFRIVATVKSPDLRFDNEDVIVLGDNWRVTSGKDTRTASLPFHADASAGETVSYSVTLTGDSKVRNSIMLRAQHQYIKIYLDGTLLKEFGYHQSSFLGDAPYAGWVLARLPDGWEGKTLTIEQTAYYDNYAGLLNEVYMGTKNALVFMVLRRCLASILFNLAILMIGVLLLCISFLFRSGYMVRQIRCLSIFAMVTSLWMVLESGGYQLVFGSAPVVSNLIFILFGMMPVACLRFILTYQCFSRSKYLISIYYLSIVNFVVQQFLQITGVCDYMQSITGTHLMILLAIGGIIREFLRLLFHKKGRTEAGEWGVYISFLVFSIFGLIDIGRFYFGNLLDSPVLFTQVGLFLFFIILSYGAVHNIVADHENSVKQEFFEHMAFLDLLTGIPNRNAFERRLKHYRTAAQEAHPMILVADLNDLKKINDTLGHAQGDAAIISVARSLLRAFSDKGFVCRIGGDEFCVLSEELDEDMMADKNVEFQRYLEEEAKERHLPITVAYGWYKESGEGIDKAFNLADELMYQRKSEIKTNIKKA